MEHQPEIPENVTTRAPPERSERRFEAEIETLIPKLFATAVRLTRDPVDAEDLVEDAIVRAWSSLDSLQDPDALDAWLHRILTNTFISQRRSEQARPGTEPYVEEPTDEGGFSLFERLHQPFLLWQSNPEQDFLNRLLRDDLARAIDDLPDAYRIAVVLVDVQGFSYRSAAETLEVPIGTVRSRLARGREQLQRSLWRQAIEGGLRSRSEDRTEARATDADASAPRDDAPTATDTTGRGP